MCVQLLGEWQTCRGCSDTAFAALFWVFTLFSGLHSRIRWVSTVLWSNQTPSEIILDPPCFTVHIHAQEFQQLHFYYMVFFKKCWMDGNLCEPWQDGLWRMLWVYTVYSELSVHVLTVNMNKCIRHFLDKPAPFKQTVHWLFLDYFCLPYLTKRTIWGTHSS